MYCSRVCLSSQAYLSIVAETYAHTGTETGGIFLGKVVNDVWYVIEVLDPGYSNIQRRPGYFEYDETYVTHLANVRARLYQNGLELLGLWHRHPGSFDSFSGTDDETHRRYTAQNPRRGAISALVNLDPHFRLTMYHIAPPAQHRRVQSVLRGDSHISSHLLAFKKPEELTGSSHSQTLVTNDTKKKKSWLGLGRFFSSSETTHAQSEEITYSSPSASTATQQDQVLDMLEYELSEYLESQKDYNYNMQMHEDSVELTMQYVGSMTYYPLRIQCKFFLRNNEKRCLIDNTDRLYTPGIIQQYVNKSIDDKMRGFDRQSIRTPQQVSPTYATAVTQRQQRPTTPPTAASMSQRNRAVDTPLQMPDKVLEMWRIEQTFLDERDDCTYEVQERDNSIELMIKSVGKEPSREIHCKLFMDGDHKMCIINDERYLYRDGIIQLHLSVLPSG